MTAFTDLPDDVVYEVLCAAPDLATLATLFKLSKRYTYDIYQSHKRSILYVVVSNLIGPRACFPDAFKLVGRTEMRTIDTTSVDSITDSLLCLKKSGRALLEDMHRTISGLEALISQR